jgi:thiamine biosynthesis lipoprotein
MKSEMPLMLHRPGKQVFQEVSRLMGNRFEFTAVSGDASHAYETISEAIEEIKRIEKLLTTFDEGSETNLINKNAGIRPMRVSREVFELIKRSIKISGITQGAFDITYGSLDKGLWNFDKNMTSLPDAAAAKKSVRLINFRNIILDDAQCSVYLREQGMRIGFGGIGKGYAAEKARQLMIRRGIHSGIVNAAGDLVTWGRQPDGKPWTIGIADPENVTKAFSTVTVSDLAVATSGSYEKYAVIDGKKYSHTVDPRTGLPVSGVKSATVICRHAELADALATPLMIMGIKVGLDMVNQIKNTGCIMIDDHDRCYTSHNLNIS